MCCAGARRAPGGHSPAHTARCTPVMLGRGWPACLGADAALAAEDSKNGDVGEKWSTNIFCVCVTQYWLVVLVQHVIVIVAILIVSSFFYFFFLLSSSFFFIFPHFSSFFLTLSSSNVCLPLWLSLEPRVQSYCSLHILLLVL